ncbi:hypothetical protein J4H86_02465 [Spiractinospora alimapuensis]|uniref:hypothetical protein n=1 Tax=Spiractinospora alimapuensis TaxID=2820884 RepID=UPI001F44A5C9|nr:hypothetical protein [Spiractinospora alimapuensis]QVQ52712.1 hypothetical protein J4H86_02465 [Spiractinospora alimapuensis]
MTLTVLEVDDTLWIADVHGVFVQIRPAPDDDTLWQAVAIDWGHLVIAQAPREHITHSLTGLTKPVLSTLLRHWWHHNRTHSHHSQ